MIDAFPDTRDDPKNFNIRTLLGYRELRQFEGIVGVLNQLQVAVERTKIQQPAPPKKSKPEGGIMISGKSYREAVIENYAHKTMEDSLELHYKEQRKIYGLRRNHALTRFVEGFEDLWASHSPLQFTEGKYEPDARQHISNTVDAAELILKQFCVPCLRSLIENKVREVREATYGIE